MNHVVIVASRGVRWKPFLPAGVMVMLLPIMVIILSSILAIPSDASRLAFHALPSRLLLDGQRIAGGQSYHSHRQPQLPLLTSPLLSRMGTPSGEQRFTSQTILMMTPRDAIAQLNQAQLDTVQSIVRTFPSTSTLQSPRMDLSWNPSGATNNPSVMINSCIATLDGREGPGPETNIAWLSSLCVESKLSSLTIYCGPLTNIPHLVSRCAVVSSNDQTNTVLNLVLDFVPRAYGAYEMRDLQGNYPGPEALGREAFTYSGNRMEYETKFGTMDLFRFMEETFTSLDGVQVREYDPNNISNLDKLVRGPLYMDILCSLTEKNVAIIQQARQRAAEYYWLSWAKQPTQYAHRPGAPINAQYVYDTKFKQNFFLSLRGRYIELFGSDDGNRLAIGDSGPLDEAYVGGGS